MQKRMHNFALLHGLDLSEKSLSQLDLYAGLVWEKKDFLNLTSVEKKEEIYTRHLCDGLAAAAFIAGQKSSNQNICIADMGAGAGYIGLTMAMALPQAQVTPSSMQRRRASTKLSRLTQRQRLSTTRLL